MMKLKTDQLELVYESGALRSFSIDGVEVLRMIYFAVRDENWITFQPEIRNESVETSEYGFQIAYEAIYRNGGEVFMEWLVKITGSGEIIFEIEGKVLQGFRTNRAGFCVLHPLEKVSDETVTILHSDGTSRSAIFPRFVAPYQPFFDIKGMEWHIETHRLNLQFEGDIFETEDQRNWGDASYKTYCTPLSRPFPKQMMPGEKVNQKITFSVADSALQKARQFVPEKQKGEFELGICSSGSDGGMSSKAIENIKNLDLDHYRVEIELSKNWKAILQNEIVNAGLLNLPLSLVLLFGGDIEKEIRELSEFISDNEALIKYLTLFDANELVTPASVINKIKLIRELFPEVKIGVGTNYNFTELNRYRLEAGSADFISFSFNPQEHAGDDTTLMENTETVKYLVESAREMYGLPVHLSPVALKRRYNPDASEASERVIPLEKQVDYRQKTDFLAEWSTRLLENLSVSGVTSVSFMQTAGDLGIMNREGETYPVYQRIEEFNAVSTKL